MIFTILLFATIVCQLNAALIPDNDTIKSLEERLSILQNRLLCNDNELDKIADRQKKTEYKLQVLTRDRVSQSSTIDSLKKHILKLEETQAAAQKNISKEFDALGNNVLTNQIMLKSRTLWGIIVALAVIGIIICVSHKLSKRIKSEKSAIGDVRKAQEALQLAQTELQEESIKLDDKLLALFDKQLQNTPKTVENDKIDHSLALKIADEIVRIELNMSRMDSSVKGYKQLAKAIERIKDNFKANGYEIVDMLGQQYNEGMKVTANFVADEGLEEGEQIITGITKPQINYNGRMIQAAQITVSQNI